MMARLALLVHGLRRHCAIKRSTDRIAEARPTRHDMVSEWPRRWTRNPLGSARGGSNPLGVAFPQTDACEVFDACKKTVPSKDSF